MRDEFQRSFVVFIDPELTSSSIAGLHCVVEPGAKLTPGEIVYLEVSGGEAIVGDYHGRTPDRWHVVRSHTDGLLSEWNPRRLKAIWAITWTGSTPPPSVIDVTSTHQPMVQGGKIRRRIEMIQHSVDLLKKELRF